MQFHKTLENMHSYYAHHEQIIADDLMKYMEKLGLRDFSGIPLPNQFVANALTHSYPVFYQEGKIQKSVAGYFSTLPEISIKYTRSVFFGGKENEQ